MDLVTNKATEIEKQSNFALSNSYGRIIFQGIQNMK